VAALHPVVVAGLDVVHREEQDIGWLRSGLRSGRSWEQCGQTEANKPPKEIEMGGTLSGFHRLRQFVGKGGVDWRRKNGSLVATFARGSPREAPSTPLRARLRCQTKYHSVLVLSVRSQRYHMHGRFSKP
jgi:hypothetical protein